MFKLRMTGLLMALALLSPAIARADCHCFCKAVAFKALSPLNPVPLKDLGKVATYTNLQCVNPGGLGSNCQTKCAAAVSPVLSNKNWTCGIIQKEGVFSTTGIWAVGTRSYALLNQSTVDVLCSGGKTVCKCPPGSVANAGTQAGKDGGITTDGKCKRAAGTLTPPFAGTSLPVNGTQLGSWGFSWGNAMYQWVAPACTTTPWTGS